jgi:hypothetical protein
MAVDPATRPRRADEAHAANGARDARARAGPAAEARWFHGRRTATGPRPPRDTRTRPTAETAGRPGRTGDGRGVASTAYASTTARTRSATLLRANPYPEVTDRFCRLPLPTLFYAARGCSPRRPAADIGTNRREDSAWPSLEFSRSAWGSRTPPQRAVLFALASLSPG